MEARRQQSREDKGNNLIWLNSSDKDEAKTVTGTVERHAPSVVDVVLHDAKTGKPETLTCTPEHPLFVQGQGWVEAGSLGIGTSIVSRAGPALQVAGLTWEKNKAQELAAGSASSTLGGYTVYNLTVDGDHTFFVGTANGGTWVHNTVCEFQIGKYNELKKASEVGDDLEIHHVPQGHPAEQVIPGYDYEDGVAIALNTSMHRGLPATSRLSGTYNGSARGLISTGLRDLNGAGVPQDVLRNLGQTIKNTYPGVYK